MAVRIRSRLFIAPVVALLLVPFGPATAISAGEALDLVALPAPLAWETRTDGDVWSASPPMEQGGVFIEVRRFSNPSLQPDLDARLALAIDTVRDFDSEARFDANPPVRSANLGDLAGRQTDATYTLDGVQRQAWVVVMAGPAGGEELLWRYVAPARIFDDFLDEAVAVLEEVQRIAGGAAPAQAAQDEAVTPAPGPTAPDAPPSSNADLEFWNSVRDKTDPAYFQAYLESFPQGVFAPLARLRIAELTADKQPPKGAPPAAVEQPRQGTAPGAYALARAPIDQCDLEAADPHDPDAVVRISNTDEFGLPQNPQGAFAACVKAIETWPDEPRFRLYLVNILDALQMGGEAPEPAAAQYDDLALIRQAAEAAYPHGLFLLGVAALNGRYIEPGSDTQQSAVDLFERAAVIGHPEARLRLAFMLEGSIGSYDRLDYDEAARLLLAGLKDHHEGSYDALFTYPESRAKQTIMALQHLLQRENLYSGRIDGDFGPRTRAAAEAWMTR